MHQRISESRNQRIEDEFLGERTTRTKHLTIAAALRLHRSVGPGFREPLYRRLLAHALKRDGQDVQQEVWIPVEFEGMQVANAVRADLIVNGCVIVELKSVTEFHPVFETQFIIYLKASGLQLGLLFNFNVTYLTRQSYRKLLHPDALAEVQKRILADSLIP